MSDIDLTYRVMRVPSDFQWKQGEPWVGYDTGADGVPYEPYDPPLGQAWQLWDDWSPASPACKSAWLLGAHLRHYGPVLLGASIAAAEAWVTAHAPEGVPA